ncbi:MAG: T9SS type A sorting domain-containing protein [Salibacteraceae bacterium]
MIDKIKYFTILALWFSPLIFLGQNINITLLPEQDRTYGSYNTIRVSRLGANRIYTCVNSDTPGVYLLNDSLRIVKSELNNFGPQNADESFCYGCSIIPSKSIYVETHHLFYNPPSQDEKLTIVYNWNLDTIKTFKGSLGLINDSMRLYTIHNPNYTLILVNTNTGKSDSIDYKLLAPDYYGSSRHLRAINAESKYLVYAHTSDQHFTIGRLKYDGSEIKYIRKKSRIPYERILTTNERIYLVNKSRVVSFNYNMDTLSDMSLENDRQLMDVIGSKFNQSNYYVEASTRKDSIFIYAGKNLNTRILVGEIGNRNLGVRFSTISEIGLNKFVLGGQIVKGQEIRDFVSKFELYTDSVMVNIDSINYVLLKPEAKKIDVIELSSNNNFKVYPNPTSGILYVKATNGNLDYNIELYSISGSLLFNKRFVNELELDVSVLEKGIYHYRIFSGNGEEVYRNRLIVQ